MEQTTPPTTPHKTEHSPSEDLLDQLRGLPQQMRRILTLVEAISSPTVASRPLSPSQALQWQPSNAGQQLSAEPATSLIRCSDSAPFWNRQVLSSENLEEMKLAFRDGMAYKPKHDINGIREWTDVDLPLRDDNPPAVYYLLAQHRDEQPNVQRIEIPLMENDSDAPDEVWEALERVDEVFLEQWPEGIPLSIINDPGHFGDDWSFFRDASLVLTELSHRTNAPERLFWKYRIKNGLTHQDWPKPFPKDNKISGRCWLVCPQEPIMNASLIAFVFTQVMSGYGIHTQSMAALGGVFLRRYMGPWPTEPWTRWYYRLNDADDEAHLQFHIRYPLLAEDFLVPGTTRCGESKVVEERVSIAITTSLRHAPPYYTIMTLADSPELLSEPMNDTDLWIKYETSHGSELGGLAVVQSVLFQVVKKWAKAWMLVLDHYSLETVYLDNALPDQDSILDFWSQQIAATSTDFHHLKRDAVGPSGNLEEPGPVESNWDDLITYQGKLGLEFLARIECMRPDTVQESH
ncbi:hypothetical protein CcaCcLH18_02313 [Colletotrichum camelliae]|nr:hypothetical protein CcaCcLH18_02313 [Colletotrichum camelliae]